MSDRSTLLHDYCTNFQRYRELRPDPCSIEEEYELHKRIAAADAMAKALEDAAESLNTVATQAGIDEYMRDALQIRGYANSRATVARAALAAYNALR